MPTPTHPITQVKFLVTLDVQDHGDMDPATFRDAIAEGIAYAYNEGYLTRLDDETTVVASWKIERLPDQVVLPAPSPV